jgi:hypothetical protein
MDLRYPVMNCSPMTITASNWAREQLIILDSGWERLVAVVERLGPDGLEQPLTRIWTVKEMLAHLAFWEETSLPVIQMMYRGGPELAVQQWYGGQDLELAADAPWPEADVHNAREARWARSRSPADVLERLKQARQKLKTVIATVTDEESRGPIAEQWSGEAICRHVDHHLAQIESSRSASPPKAG